MGLIAKDTGGGEDFTPVPQGTHIAVCNMVADLGLQETTFNGEAKVKHQCFVRWELPYERVEYTDQSGAKQEGPMMIGKVYTLSLSEKANLRKDLEAWRGKSFTPPELEGFDLFNLLGVGCQVTVTHREKGGKVYANVTGIAGWPKGMEKPGTTENALLKYSEDDRADFEKLPEWLRKKISEAKPADHSTQQDGDPGADDPGDYGSPGGDLDDEIPF